MNGKTAQTAAIPQRRGERVAWLKRREKMLPIDARECGLACAVPSKTRMRYCIAALAGRGDRPAALAQCLTAGIAWRTKDSTLNRPLVWRGPSGTTGDQDSLDGGWTVLHSSMADGHRQANVSSKWRGATLGHFKLKEGYWFENAWPSILITHKISTPGHLFMAQDGRFAPPPDANLQVYVPGALYRGTCETRMEALSVDLDRSLVDRTLNIPYSKSLVAQAARRLHRDPLTVHLMQALLSDVIAGSPGGPLLGETIIAALVHRLHAAARAPAAEQHGRLSRSEMNLVREYIDANLSSPLHLDALADLTGMSTRHFCRVFRNTMGSSPHQHVLRCRVERALNLLSDRRQSLDDIAEAAGFADRAHMGACFRKLGAESVGGSRNKVRLKSNNRCPEFNHHVRFALRLPSSPHLQFQHQQLKNLREREQCNSVSSIYSRQWLSCFPRQSRRPQRPGTSIILGTASLHAATRNTTLTRAYLIGPTNSRPWRGRQILLARQRILRLRRYSLGRATPANQSPTLSPRPTAVR